MEILNDFRDSVFAWLCCWNCNYILAGKKKMTQDEIIRMAREAGGCLTELPNGDAWLFDDNQQLERFAALVASHIEDQQYALGYLDGMSAGKIEGIEAEREACAKVCDDIDTEYEGEDVLATWCAAAIRARGESRGTDE